MPKCLKPGCPNLQEEWDGDTNGYCVRHNNELIERNENRAEWNYYHPGEPCPEIELKKKR